MATCRRSCRTPHGSPRDHPEFHDAGEYFTMSGTSQAAAVVSGAAVLMLQANPSLTPDDGSSAPPDGLGSTGGYV